MFTTLLFFALQVSAATQTITPDNMKELESTVFKDADIEYKNANGRYRIQAPSVEIKKNGIVASGAAKFTVLDGDKDILLIETLPPENTLVFDTQKGIITSSAGKMKFKGKNYEGRGLDANLEKRKVSWVQMVKRNGKAVKGVLDLKF